jgi:hypothetical protein
MPGSGKQSAQVQQQIIEFLEAGIDPTTIHRRLKVGRSSIYRMKRCLQQHGTAYAPPETNKKNGRPKVMTADQERVSVLKAACLWFDRQPKVLLPGVPRCGNGRKMSYESISLRSEQEQGQGLKEERKC